MKKWKLMLSLAVPLALLIGWIAWADKALTVTELTVPMARLPESFDGLRIAHVSDLHNAEFGERNEKLLTLIREQQPDIIAVTGDLIDSRRTDADIALRFAEGAAAVAPVYYAPGNHESRVPKDYLKLTEGLKKLGVTVLEDQSVTLEKDGSTLRITGMLDMSFFREGFVTETAARTMARLENALGEGDLCTVLLSHRPDLFENYAERGIDLTLAGHLHGGQFRLPLIGGLASIGQRDAGLYTEKDKQMVVSRGLGNSLFPFRFNNRPELVMLTLKKVE
ncbi:MAG: metallophosphoesterase [Oscillospiraceae bacterium]|nr:metallophosphoesterase [Oscillospiraceae bacterium]